MRLNIGSDATPGGTLMPSDQYWVRITADQRSDGAGAIIEIAAQAARATLVSNIPDTPSISAGTISKLVNKVPALSRSNKIIPPSMERLLKAIVTFFRRVVKDYATATGLHKPGIMNG
jgi:hypothetical protein